MELTGVGSGVMVALAACLWLVYLVPSWLRNREFTATERNAVRLQQTLRVLAETAEMPTAVRAEATARSVAEQEKLRRLEQRRRAEVVKAQVAAARPVLSAARRLRRTRAVTSLVLLAAVIVLAIQLPAAFVSGVTGSGFAVILFSGIVLVSALAMLGRLNEVGKARAVVVAPVEQAAPVARRRTVPNRVTDAAPAQTTWTPIPVPKPLYLSRQVAPAPAVTAAAIAAELDRASRTSEHALRAAQAAPEITPIRRPAPEPAAAPSRFAAMGRLDEADLGRTDVDEVLRRRRAAG